MNDASNIEQIEYEQYRAIKASISNIEYEQE